MRGKRVPDAANLTADLIEKYRQGASIRMLAKEIGYSYGFVHSVLKAAGVRFRTRGGNTRGGSK